MRLLLDTHVVLWTINGDSRLRPAVRNVIADPNNDVYFGYASLWEAGIKLAQGRLSMPGDDIDFILDVVSGYKVELIGIGLDHIRVAATLPFHHGDPFDRMIAAQALVEDLTPVTEDPKLRLYNGRVFPW